MGKTTGEEGGSGEETNAAFTFIEKKDYIGESTNAFSDSKKIAVLNADKLAGGNYMLSDGREFFHSEKLGGYVIFVDKDETVESLSSKLRLDTNHEIEEVPYTGDLNRSRKPPLSGEVAAQPVAQQPDRLTERSV